MKVLKQWVMDRLEEIQDKYRFRSTMELEQADVYDFCHDFLLVESYGLEVDDEDSDFINELMDKLCE